VGEGGAATGEASKLSDREAELFTTSPDADDERADLTPEELEAEEMAKIEAVTATAEAESPRDATAEALWRRELALLDRMREIAENARHLPDAKTKHLIDWIRPNLCPHLPPFGKQVEGQPPKWNHRRVVIFTENREGTKRYLKMILEQAIEGSERPEERIEVIDGLTSSARRKEIQRRFNTDPDQLCDPLRCGLPSYPPSVTFIGFPAPALSARRQWWSTTSEKAARWRSSRSVQCNHTPASSRRSLRRLRRSKAALHHR
jgi:hypothetical protein